MESFEQLLKDSEIVNKEGVQKGIVVRKTSDGVLLDLKSKAEKFIPKSDFNDNEWAAINLGDEIDVYIESGRPSYKEARKIVALVTLNDSFRNKTPIDVTIKKAVKGGYIAEFSGYEIFIPGSLAGRGATLRDGEVYTAIITRVIPGENKIVCSIADYQNQIGAEKLSHFFETAHAGDEVTGNVKKIIEKGVFVDLGGFDGFIPFSEITFKRIRTPHEVIKEGASVSARILDINQAAKKITLSTKALETDPWERFVAKFKEENKIEGLVRGIIDQGVFVEIIDGVDGFIPASEISWTERINDPRRHFKLKDKVACVIKRIDADKKKISLSFREMISNPWQEFREKQPVGTVMTVTVKESTGKGIVVNVTGDMEGFVPREYISWTKVKGVKDTIKAGDEIQVKFMECDIKRRRLIFSMRDVTENPWSIAAAKFKAGDEIDGTVSGISDTMVFVTVMPHVEGVVKKDEFSKGKNEVTVKIGDTLQFLIKEFNPDNQRMALTHTGLISKREREALAEIKSKNAPKTTLGDFLKIKR